MKDQWNAPSPPKEDDKVKDIVEVTSGQYFKMDGAPLSEEIGARRNGYQRKWFDYFAYEQIVNEEYVATVLDDFFELGNLGFIYQPWVQFAEPLYNGRLVNVTADAKGFPMRQTINPKIDNTKVMKIFVLGGSTTFGYNVSDEHTWPSFLSAILNGRIRQLGHDVSIEVMNYGRGFFNLSQETVLLIDLLKSGHRPQLVIFMDGVNWGPDQDVPEFSSKVAQGFFEIQFGSSILKNFGQVPVIRLANFVKRKLIREDWTEEEGVGIEDNRVQQVVNRFNANQAIAEQICALYSITSLFFLQPDAVDNYPIGLYRLSVPDGFMMERTGHQEFYDQMRDNHNFISLRHLFELWGAHRKAIVDDVHYSPNFNKFLAEQVAGYIDLETLVKNSLVVEEVEGTGSIRQIALARQ